MKLAVVSLILALLATASLLAQQDEQFAGANRDYAGGNFKQAAAGYEELVRQGNFNAPLFYNLGNAWFRLHDYGKAILNYERALALEPGHPEAQTNLGIAREEAHALELPATWLDRIRASATPNELTLAACVLFWIGLFILASLVGEKGRRRGRAVLGTLILLAAAGLAVIIALSERGTHGSSFAIVTANEARARLATADTAANVLTLPSGSELQIEQKRGDWAYALLPNGPRGWIPLNQIEAVRL